MPLKSGLIRFDIRTGLTLLKAVDTSGPLDPMPIIRVLLGKCQETLKRYLFSIYERAAGVQMRHAEENPICGVPAANGNFTRFRYGSVHRIGLIGTYRVIER
jgi:hypothetical protein